MTHCGKQLPTFLLHTLWTAPQFHRLRLSSLFRKMSKIDIPWPTDIPIPGRKMSSVIASRHMTWVALVWGLALSTPVVAQTLEDQLRSVPASLLATQAKLEGDAVRGAIVFHQQQMACSKCHSVTGAAVSVLGPDLTLPDKNMTDETIVESVLTPSKVIRKGFESVVVATVEGKTLAGIVVERTPEKLVLRDASRLGELVTLTKADIDEIKDNPLSLMPAGQVNQLASRQQFLDLIRYLIEIREQGPNRAQELQPSPALLTFTIPEYEQHLDHAGLIQDWNGKSLKRGEAIYQRVCANCHGTKDRLGSLPNSLRFAEGKFKNGSEPLAMYQTLTRGFGLMAPQTWMVPSQKYDVIHYIRETYLKPHNPSQFVAVDEAYLARLPQGDTRGPEPSLIEPWSAMDYGPQLTHTYEIHGATKNLAYKGIAVRLDPGAGGVSRGRHWMIFDTDTMRMAAQWNAGKSGEQFIDWRGIQLNGEHQVHPHVVGPVTASNSTGPGWADPQSGSFTDDRRVEGRDGLRYGPLPRDWSRYRGMYYHGQNVILSYSVGKTDVLEMPRVQAAEEPGSQPLFLRTFEIGPRDRELVLQVAEQPVPTGVVPLLSTARLTTEGGRVRLRIAAGAESLRFTLWASDSPTAQKTPAIADPELDLASLTHGGPARWPLILETEATTGPDEGPFAVDVLTPPDSNPWLAQLRFSGLDFLPDGKMAVCTWDGDVWLIESVAESKKLRWQRIATGLFQPLGLKVVEGNIYLTCRDQLVVLRDLNGDRETDFYECLNNDHQVTEHFHEFAMGLQTDAEGRFYYAKSGRHALKAIVPHHGTLLRVSQDGSQTEILATGFRAANGVCMNPDGSFVVTDQEGFWNPKNRINWVTLDPSGQPNFYGNMFGYTDVTDSSDSAMVPPLCWITNDFDRSPAELLWVESQKWGALHGSLLNLSYGTGKVFVVPHERAGTHMQGGMIQLPIPAFPTGVMRGRFNANDGQLYLCGMFAWAGSATQPGGLYRLRATGQPAHLPLGLHATQAGLKLTFAEPLDPAALDAQQLQVKTWSLQRTAKYGSKHFDEKTLEVEKATLSEDRRTLTIQVADLQPTWGMEIRYTLRFADGATVPGVIHNTIHSLEE